MAAADLEEAKKRGVVNILKDYNVKLPMDTIKEVQKFSEDMFNNNLIDPKTKVTRNRRGELVSF